MPVREQSSLPQDDAACRFIGQGDTYATLAVDQSQREDDVASDADAIFENSARFNHGSPRTMVWRFNDLASTDTGAIWRHGTGPNLEYLDLQGDGSVRMIVNNATQILWQMPSTLGFCWLAWSTEPNPDPDAGASDAMQSWLMFHSVTSGESAKVRVTHPAKNSQSVSAYVGAASTGGFGACTEQIRVFGHWSRLVSMTELAEWFWDTIIPPATVAGTEEQQPPLASGTLDVQNEAHGPAAQLAAAALSHTRWRTMGALANERYRNVQTITNTTSTLPDNQPKYRPALGSGSYVWHLGWFRAYPVSPTANAFYVRVHARVWSIVPGQGTGYWGLRLYALSRKPVVGQTFVDEGELPEPLQWRVAGEEVTDDNSDSDDFGAWRIDAVIPAVRGESGISRGRVYLALGFVVDPNAAAGVPQEDLRLEVNAVHLVQLFDATPGQPSWGGPSDAAG